jgi:rhodanese-related sulfurtransferase/polyisoprenoid-binding protein YceI
MPTSRRLREEKISPAPPLLRVVDMMSTILNASQLKERLDRRDLVLLDVRLPEDFACSHLPGAENQCVYEVTFLPEIEKKNHPKDKAVCVYGAGEDSHESRMAAEKLERMGFTQVFDFRGGLDAWTAAGNTVESKGAAFGEPKIADGTHSLDLKESKVLWTGRNLINKHCGEVALASGLVVVRDGLPASGEATLDLKRITCTDLAGETMHDVLIQHLGSDDFFDVARFPAAKFTFDRAECTSKAPGCTNLRLLGALTMRGVTKPLVIAAAAGITSEGKAALQSAFTLDRTDWGVLYGSGRFFRRLAGHLVNDTIELQLRLLTA